MSGAVCQFVAAALCRRDIGSCCARLGRLVCASVNPHCVHSGRCRGLCRRAARPGGTAGQRPRPAEPAVRHAAPAGSAAGGAIFEFRGRFGGAAAVYGQRTFICEKEHPVPCEPGGEFQMTRRLLPAGRSSRSGEQPHPVDSWIRPTLALAAVVAAGLSWPAAADPYRLGVQDKLRVKVVDWRAGKGEYYEWEVITDEYVVNPAGSISLPLVGEVTAQGRTTEELAASVSDQLQKRVGPIGKPLTSVEIVTFRPVYVLGYVEHPGEYAYRPGLTVMQAVGIAGGFYRLTDAGLLRLERDRIAAIGEREAARIGLQRALVRRARLEAERDGADKVKIPEELNGDPNIGQLLGEETAIMKARLQQLKFQLAALNDLKILFAQEVQSLADKTVAQNQEIDLARRELKSYGALTAKGLAISSREFLLQRTVVELEGKILDIDTASLRAKQEI